MRDATHALFATAVLLLACLACRGGATSEKAKRAKAAAEEQEKVELDARFRRECHVKDGGLVFSIYDDDLKDQCHAHVESNLKVPGSAEYPYAEDKSKGLTTDDGCNRIFESHFTAKNAFGVMVRTDYTCKYDPRTSALSVTTR